MGCLKKCSVVLSALVVAFAIGVALIPHTLVPDQHTESWLFFDGVCNLCDGFVNFVADNDEGRRVKFGAIQKHTDLMKSRGAALYAEGGAEYLSTLVLIQDDQVYVRSSAALRVMALLPAPINYLSVFHAIPAVVRDFAYKTVAEYRYLVFGKTEECRSPSKEFQSRFLEYREPEASTPFEG